jgi:hypothetical protein
MMNLDVGCFVANGHIQTLHYHAIVKSSKTNASNYSKHNGESNDEAPSFIPPNIFPGKLKHELYG